MACEYCHRMGTHDYRCPNYIAPKARHYCSICDNGIYGGEEYIENFDSEYAHYDCVTDLPYRAMIEWLSGEIRTMEDNYGEDY